MLIRTILLIILTVNTLIFSLNEKGYSRTPKKDQQIMVWPKDWSNSLGKTVILEGRAANAKMGALLQGKENSIWIDGLDSWPESIFTKGDKREVLRVTGIVIKKDDLPVFIQKAGDPQGAGMPVKSQDNVEREKWRYLLKNATWEVIK